MTSPLIQTHMDRANAEMLGSAGLMLNREQTEQAQANGVYAASCWEPLPQYREKYIQVRDQLAELQMGSLLKRLAFSRRIKFLKEMLEDIPQQQVWAGLFPNVVCTVGKNVMLDAALAGSAYTVVGPYMGLISSTSYTAVAAADTMTAHAGWLEAGAANAPTYTAPRKTCAWSAASAGAKALSASLSFAMTGAGTVKGCFIVYGTGALSTIDNTAGTLYSAGTFTGGDQPVVNGNTLAVSYSTSL
jgi:hypothetical protein